MSFFTRTIIDDFLSKLSVPNMHIVMLSDIKRLNANVAAPNVLFSPLIGSVCGKNIGDDYISTIKTLYNDPTTSSDMDMAILLNSPLENLFSQGRSNEISIRNINNSSVMGILITQRGECTKYPSVHTVNLICSPPLFKKGSALMALYLYTIKSQPNINATDNGAQLGLLELANGYINTGGLCMYSKYGFKYDVALFGPNCFSDISNLPMAVNLTQTSLESIISIANNSISGHTKPKICEIRDSMLQPLLGMSLNLLIQITYNKSVVPFIASTHIVYDYLYLWETICKKQKPILEQLINDIYNNPTSSLIRSVNMDMLVITPMRKKRPASAISSPPPVPRHQNTRGRVGMSSAYGGKNGAKRCIRRQTRRSIKRVAK